MACIQDGGGGQPEKLQRSATSRAPATASATAAGQPQATPCQAAVGSLAHDVLLAPLGRHPCTLLLQGQLRIWTLCHFAMTCHQRPAQCTLRSGLSRMQCAPPACGSTASSHPGGRAPPPMPRPAATEFAVNMALPVAPGRCCPARMPCPQSLGVVRSFAAVQQWRRAGSNQGRYGGDADGVRRCTAPAAR